MALRSATSVRPCRPAFTASRVAPVRAPLRLSRNTIVRAEFEGEGKYVPGQWPNPEFIKETLAAFPEKGLATIEEARCLFSNGGYTWLDVRSQLECEEVGKVKGSVNVPFVILKRVYDPESRTKVMKKDSNPDFIKQVQKQFPKKDHKLMVACSNGKAYTFDALESLEEAGYTNLCFVRGGYNAWFRVFDNKFNRRRAGEYAEKYDGWGSDSCGIHASGAGFDKVDKADQWSLPVY